MRVGVVGLGAVGRRVVEALEADPRCDSVVVLSGGPSSGSAPRRDGYWGDGDVSAAAEQRWRTVRRAEFGAGPRLDVTVIASPVGVLGAALAALESGSHVVSPVDDPAVVRSLLDLGRDARAAGLTVAAGTAMAPGLSCVLATRLAEAFDTVEEVHVASLGTGGPACARRHHAALGGISVDWVDGEWLQRPGGSGRELVWFPDPIGGADCYRAALADPVLLAPAFPDARRLTARIEATRRDRLTARLPMLRKPHPEGLLGAVRVEMRGRRDGRAETRILGAARAPAVTAAAVTSLAAIWAASGRLDSGAGGLAGLCRAPGDFLVELRGLGVAISAFQGAEE